MQESARAKGPSSPLPQFVGVVEVAAMLRIDKSTVYRWTSAGGLPRPSRIGGTLRWRLDALLSWIEAHSGDLTENTTPNSTTE